MALSRVWSLDVMWISHFRSLSVLPALDILVCIKVLPLSEKFEVLSFEIPCVNKANYVNDKIFSFVYFATCCIFPAVTVVLYFYNLSFSLCE